MKPDIQLPLQFATNMLGKLNPKTIKRVEKYMKNPSFEKWEDIHCIIISGEGEMKTIWNAIREIDPFYPPYGRKTNMQGDVLREWDYIPTPEDVRKAISKVVFKDIATTN